MDWTVLHAHFRTLDTQQSTDELAGAWQRGEILEPMWAPEYLAALQQSLEAGDDAPLLALLDDQRLLHPCLLPLVAERLRRRAQGLDTGAPVKLVEHDKAFIRHRFAHRHVGQTVGDFDIEMAQVFGVSPKTIERVRLKPPTPVSSPK